MRGAHDGQHQRTATFSDHLRGHRHLGGFAQTLVISLIALTGSPIAPSLYVMFGAAIGLAGTFLLVDPAGAARIDAGDTAGIEAV